MNTMKYLTGIDYVRRVSTADLVGRFLIPLLDALILMHSEGFVHGDLKLENILIVNKEKLNVSVGDFSKIRQLGRFHANRLGVAEQHIPPDTTIGPQLDVYSVGVLAFQLLFGFDFIKNFQISGRSFETIPEARSIEAPLLDFISHATEPSALYRFKSARQAREFLVNPKATPKLAEERYNLHHYFEFYYKSMSDVFTSSHRTLADFENFVGPFGKNYFERLRKWTTSGQFCLLHMKMGHDLVGICESSLNRDGKGLINTLFVSPHHRGKGIAQLLEKKALEFFAIHGISKAILHVTNGNLRARAFYKKEGWTELGPGNYEGSIEMGKTLDLQKFNTFPAYRTS